MALEDGKGSRLGPESSSRGKDSSSAMGVKSPVVESYRDHPCERDRGRY